MGEPRQFGSDDRQTGGVHAPVSLLLRCWLEPNPGAGPVVRGMLRNLQTGEESPIGDVDAVGCHVLRHLGWDGWSTGICVAGSTGTRSLSLASGPTEGS